MSKRKRLIQSNKPGRPKKVEAEAAIEEQQGLNEAGLRLLEEQFGSSGITLLRELTGDKNIMEAAKMLQTVSGAFGAVAQQNERALKVQTEAGRLVDMNDADLLLDILFSDWMAEIRAIPAALEYELAAKFGTEIKVMREILQQICGYIMKIGESSAETTESRINEFMREQADRARRRVDGARHRKPA